MEHSTRVLRLIWFSVYSNIKMRLHRDLFTAIVVSGLFITSFLLIWNMQSCEKSKQKQDRKQKLKLIDSILIALVDTLFLDCFASLAMTFLYRGSYGPLCRRDESYLTAAPFPAS